MRQPSQAAVLWSARPPTSLLLLNYTDFENRLRRFPPQSTTMFSTPPFILNIFLIPSSSCSFLPAAGRRVLCGFIYLSPCLRVSVSPFPGFPVSVFFDDHFGWLQDLPELVEIGKGPLPFGPNLFHHPDKFAGSSAVLPINANDVAIQGIPPFLNWCSRFSICQVTDR